MGTYARLPVEFVRGEGTRLWDADGEEYLDFLGGIAVASIGHAHPRWVAAVQAQAGRLAHVGNLFYTEPGMRLARRLAETSLGGKVFFCNSGAEASECAHQARPPPPRGRRHRRGRARLPRPDLRRAQRHPAGGQAGAVRAARAGLPGRAARRPARVGRRAHRRGARRADPGRVRHPCAGGRDAATPHGRHATAAARS